MPFQLFLCDLNTEQLRFKLRLFLAALVFVLFDLLLQCLDLFVLESHVLSQSLAVGGDFLELVLKFFELFGEFVLLLLDMYELLLFLLQFALLFFNFFCQVFIRFH